VCQALAVREIVVDFRPDAGLRVAPHFYNTDQEVVTAVRAIREILDRGEHRPFLAQQKKPG
jgi:kynureninase